MSPTRIDLLAVIEEALEGALTHDHGRDEKWTATVRASLLHVAALRGGECWMTDWQRIETAPKNTIDNYLLWNGKRVFFGWLSDEGWIDSTTSSGFWSEEPEVPQPTHWLPLPPTRTERKAG